jgi:hypothetical protein
MEYAQAQQFYKHNYPVCGTNISPVTGAEAVFSMPGPVSSPPYSTPLNIKSEFKPDLSPCANVTTMPTYCLPPYNMCTTMTEVCRVLTLGVTCTLQSIFLKRGKIA